MDLPRNAAEAGRFFIGPSIESQKIKDDKFVRRMVSELTEKMAMPHDKNGVELKLGDIVTIRAKVTNLALVDYYCNCTVELVEPMITSESTNQKVTISQLNTKQVVKEP